MVVKQRRYSRSINLSSGILDSRRWRSDHRLKRECLLYRFPSITPIPRFHSLGSQGGRLPAGRAEIPILPAPEGGSPGLGLPDLMDSSFAQSASHEAPYILWYVFLTPTPLFRILTSPKSELLSINDENVFWGFFSGQVFVESGLKQERRPGNPGRR